jgi:hypothetical protein
MITFCRCRECGVGLCFGRAEIGVTQTEGVQNMSCWEILHKYINDEILFESQDHP